jgi:hypothetical protein
MGGTRKSMIHPVVSIPICEPTDPYGPKRQNGRATSDNRKSTSPAQRRLLALGDRRGSRVLLKAGCTQIRKTVALECSLPRLFEIAL